MKIGESVMRQTHYAVWVQTDVCKQRDRAGIKKYPCCRKSRLLV